VVTNPFRPTFGTSPPVLAGRREHTASFADSLDAGPGAPGRATLYTGARGVGKTVMLNAAEDVARERGWIVISETASPGIVHRLVHDHLPGALALVTGSREHARVSGLTAPAGLGAISVERVPPVHRPERSLRNQLTDLASVTAAHGAGVLITVDEIHGGDVGELRELAVTVQHCFRSDLDVAFAAAALPAAVASLLNDRVLTFLRRAERHDLGPLSRGESALAIVGPIRSVGLDITPEALDLIVDASGGYPFMVQLVGFHTLRNRPERRLIDADDAVRGITAARRRLGHLVVEPELQALSSGDRRFLSAMAVDDGPSRTADIARRLGVSGPYAGQYRLRLLAAGVITAPKYGWIDFAIPGVREHLRRTETHG